MGTQPQSFGLERLTQPQIDVLARVAQFKSSKQVARELGISHHTVDQRVRAIIGKMGVKSRADAARIFLEARDIWGLGNQLMRESLAYQIPDQDVAPYLPDQDAPPSGWNPAGGEQEQRPNEAQAFSVADASRARADLAWVSVLLNGDGQNDLTAWGRTICILLIMLLIFLTMSSLVGLAHVSHCFPNITGFLDFEFNMDCKCLLCGTRSA